PVASPSLLAGRKPPTLGELAKLPLLGPEEIWQNWFALHGGRSPQRYVASFNDAESRQRAALGGLGVALGRTTMVRPLIETGQLVTLFPEMMKGKRAHYLVYPERSRKHPGFVAFREWLLDEAASFRAAPPMGFAGTPKRERSKRAPRQRKRA
ncbi:MAG: biotin transporter BioY, partial [Xanthomonadaceae bacterium]|nr:biotin transporter BioY [Xanthomonadaceae bacterium]